MAEHPVLLMYNIDVQRKAKILSAAVRMKIRCLTISPDLYGAPIGELVTGINREYDISDKVFSEPMIVMANFSGMLVNAFLNALRASRMSPIALKAVMTPTNASWDSYRLHDEILSEHKALHRNNGRSENA